MVDDTSLRRFKWSLFPVYYFLFEKKKKKIAHRKNVTIDRDRSCEDDNNT